MNLEARKQIWRSLSAFYLDTELDELELAGIAGVFVQSGCSIAEIKKIDLYEVFPVLQPNLWRPAGEWTGFDDEWLFEQCTRNFNRRDEWPHQLKCRCGNALFYWMRRDYWDLVAEKMK
jgi:hypothetical protein